LLKNPVSMIFSFCYCFCWWAENWWPTPKRPTSHNWHSLPYFSPTSHLDNTSNLNHAIKKFLLLSSYAHMCGIFE
jgi:hypothetical protein